MQRGFAIILFIAIAGGLVITGIGLYGYMITENSNNIQKPSGLVEDFSKYINGTHIPGNVKNSKWIVQMLSSKNSFNAINKTAIFIDNDTITNPYTVFNDTTRNTWMSCNIRVLSISGSHLDIYVMDIPSSGFYPGIWNACAGHIYINSDGSIIAESSYESTQKGITLIGPTATNIGISAHWINIKFILESQTTYAISINGQQFSTINNVRNINTGIINSIPYYTSLFFGFGDGFEASNNGQFVISNICESSSA